MPADRANVVLVEPTQRMLAALLFDSPGYLADGVPNDLLNAVFDGSRVKHTLETFHFLGIGSEDLLS